MKHFAVSLLFASVFVLLLFVSSRNDLSDDRMKFYCFIIFSNTPSNKAVLTIYTTTFWLFVFKVFLLKKKVENETNWNHILIIDCVACQTDDSTILKRLHWTQTDHAVKFAKRQIASAYCTLMGSLCRCRCWCLFACNTCMHAIHTSWVAFDLHTVSNTVINKNRNLWVFC